MPLASLFPSFRRLQEQAAELETQIEDLKLDLQEVEDERNGAKLGAEKVQQELHEAQQRESRLKEDLKGTLAMRLERDRAQAQAAQLDEEKAIVERELREVRGEVEMHRARLWVPPGHQLSPITDPNDPYVRETGMLRADALKDREDLAIDEAEMLQLLGWLGEHAAKFPFDASLSPRWRFYTGNGHFGHADAAIFFAMLMEFKPARYIELGCGHASLLAMDVNDHFLDRAVEMTFYDPRPDGIGAILSQLDAYREQVHTRRSQDVPEKVFQQLRRGDILSIESSHVAKTGSDVCDIFFRILPLLAPGVLIHIHDIYYPFEYPDSWVVQENRSWNETYLLRAFLQYNAKFRVRLFNNLLLRRQIEAFEKAFPGIDDPQGSSLWLEKRD